MKLAKETALYNEGAVEEVNEKAELAGTQALEALQIAGNTDQYFWHTETGTDTGAHITEIPQADFIANPENGGGNLLARSNGIAVRDGLTELSLFGASGVRLGQTDNNNVQITPDGVAIHSPFGQSAVFNADSAVIGALDSQRLEIDALGIKGFNTENALFFDVDYDAGTVEIPTNQQIGATNSATSKGADGGDTVTLSTVSITIPSNVANGTALRLTEGRHRFEKAKNSAGLVVNEVIDSSGMSMTGYSYRETAGANFTLQQNASLSYITVGTQKSATGYIKIRTSGGNVRFDINIQYNPTTRIIKETLTMTPSSTTNNRVTVSYLTSVLTYNYFTTVTTTAPAMTFGVRSDMENVGGFSSAIGQNLIARGENQTVVGKLNAEDTGNTYGFIVGNGSATNLRSNALTVDWNGNEVIAGTLTQSSDRRLKKHVAYLDEDAVEFIRKLKPAHFVKDEEDHVGFYAQDVEKEDKWNCMTGEMNGYKTLGYTEIIAPLVAYCQHLEARINELERKQNG